MILKGIHEIESCATQFIIGCMNAERSNKKKFSLIKQNAKFLAISVFPLVESKIKVFLFFIKFDFNFTSLKTY